MKIKNLSIPFNGSLLKTLIFGLNFFLLFFLADTFHQWWLIPTFIFSGLLYYGTLNRIEISLSPVILLKNRLNLKHFFFKHTLILVWLAFILVSLVSGYFSTNFALSFSSLFRDISLFLIFWIIYYRAKSLSSIRHKVNLAFTILIFCIAMTFFSIFSLFMSQIWGLSLPDFTLFYPSYGHNHFANVLILFLPIIWWFLYNKKIRYWPIFLVVGYSLLLMSFGRVAIIIGLLQPLMLVLLLKRSDQISSRRLKNFFANNKLKQILLSVGLTSVIFIGFSFSGFFSSHHFCTEWDSSRLICKSSSGSARLEYWRQAVLAIDSRPIFGYGPGTFYLISKKLSADGLTVSNAHNQILEYSAEHGLIAGFLFFLLIILIAKNLYDSAIKDNSFFSIAVSIAVFSVIIKSMFDYTWSFYAIAASTLMLSSFAISIKNNVTTRQKSNEGTSLSRFKLIASALFIFFIPLLYLLSEFLLATGNHHLVAKHFPPFYHQSIIMANYAAQDDEIENYLSTHYRHHPKVLSWFLENNPNHPNWLKFYYFYDKTSPTHRYYFPDLYLRLKAEGRQDDLEKELRQTLFGARSLRSNILEKSTIRDFLLNEYFAIGQSWVDLGDYDRALSIFELISDYDFWFFSNNQLSFISQEFCEVDGNELSRRVVFLRNLSELNADFGYNSVEYGSLYFACWEKQLTQSGKAGDLISAKILEGDISAIIDLDEWLAFNIWKVVFSHHELVLSNRQELSSVIAENFFHLLPGLNQIITKQGRFITDSERNFVARVYQQAALDHFKNGQNLKAIETTRAMRDLMPTDYAIMAQPGHLYSALGHKQKAIKAYSSCIRDIKELGVNDHFECSHGLDLLHNGEPWSYRYAQVARVILGESTWDDFKNGPDND